MDSLRAVLLDARALLMRPGNDFAWSSWEDADAAVTEIDAAIAGERSAAILFAPTGPLQEVAESSAWGAEFLVLADRFDALPAEFD